MRSQLKKQHGAVLLIMAIIVTLAFLTVFLQFKGASTLRAPREGKDAALLAEAKNYLLAHAIKQTPPGILPCPDTDNDGLENTTLTGCTRALGFLPYRTLQMAETRDSSASKLWYAIEPRLAGNASDLKNSSTSLSLSLDGAPMVAVILSPGIAQSNQNRNNYNANNYLESTNSDGNLATYTQTTSDSANDQVVGLNPLEFWYPIEKVVQRQAGDLLLAYKAACGEYPWAATFGQAPYNSVANSQSGALPFDSASPTDWGNGCAVALTPASWLSQHWNNSLYFHFCLTSAANCLSLIGDNTSGPSAILMTPGPLLTGQVRPGTTLTNYFESENSDGNNGYRLMDRENFDDAFNDSVYLIEN